MERSYSNDLRERLQKERGGALLRLFPVLEFHVSCQTAVTFSSERQCLRPAEGESRYKLLRNCNY
jgi:hypothetical protein